MIGASAAPIRSACAGVIIPFSNSPNRGICTPDRMYCQRYAARTVALGLDLDRRHAAAAGFDEVL